MSYLAGWLIQAAKIGFNIFPCFTDGAVVPGQTATIGFWQNKNGQQLITSLNGGEDAVQLSSWLGLTFPNMYGASAGDHNLLNGDGDLLADADGDGDPAFDPMTNAQVANFYRDLFRMKKKEAQELGLGGPVKMDAQVMAVAFATYVTSETLAGTTAAELWISRDRIRGGGPVLQRWRRRRGVRRRGL